MNVVAYALLAYGLTALISFLTVGIIVIISKSMGKQEQQQG